MESNADRYKTAFLIVWPKPDVKNEKKRKENRSFYQDQKYRKFWAQNWKPDLKNDQNGKTENPKIPLNTGMKKY